MTITIPFKRYKLRNKLAESGNRNLAIRVTDSPTFGRNASTPLNLWTPEYIFEVRENRRGKRLLSRQGCKSTGNRLYENRSTSHAGTHTRLQVNHVCNVCCFSSAAAAAAAKITISTSPRSSNKSRKDVHSFACHIREGVVPGQP